MCVKNYVLCVALLLLTAMSTQETTLQDEIASLNMTDDMDTNNTIVATTNHQATQTLPTPYLTVQDPVPVGDNAVVAYYSHYAAPPPLSHELLASKFVSPSVYIKKGFFIQFINNNASCSPTVIGGTRTNETDVRRIPAYIEANEAHITKLAVRTLVKHLQTTQCSTACLETLCDSDFGVSFSLASLSGKGMSLNPSRRHEAPLFYCHVPGLVEPCFVSQEKQTVETAHMVNCYVHILPANQRRNKLIANAKEARIAAASAMAAPAVPKPAASPRPPANVNAPPGKMAKMSRGRSNSRARPYPKGPNQAAQHRGQPHKNPPPSPTVNGAIQHAQQQHKGTQISNPPLPTTKAPSWVSNNDDLPDDV